MPLFVQVVVTGLAAGAVYGLVATGYAVAYRTTGVVHLALGESIGVATLVTLLVSGGGGDVVLTSVPPDRFLVALAAGLAVAAGLGLLTYRVAVRPFLRRGSALGWVGAVVALAFAMRGFLSATFARESYAFPDPIPFRRIGTDGALPLGGGATVPVRAFFVLAVGLALAGLASWFLSRTRSGLALRGIASDVGAAHAVGLPVERLLLSAFAAIGVVTALAAILAAPGAPFTAGTGGTLGLKGLVAALLARFGSPGKALLAGLGIGVLEAAVVSLGVGGLRLGPAWRDIVPLLLALVVMGMRRREIVAVE